MIYGDTDDMADADIEPDNEFETGRSAAQQEVDDAQDDLLLAQLAGDGIHAARKKVSMAKASLAVLEQDGLNDHAFDLIAMQTGSFAAPSIG